MVGATSDSDVPNVSYTPVTLEFGPDGLSQQVVLSLDRPLGPTGVYRCSWSWTARRPTDESSAPVGQSEHHLYVTWRAPLQADTWALPVYGRYKSPSPSAPRANWTYEQLVAWSCEWVAGAGDPKSICDAIIANARRSGLKYYVDAWDVRTMLLKGGGMCGGWYKMFQALAAAHGVAVERRSYSVDWRELGASKEMWCAIVVRAPGLNRSEPVERASVFHDTVDGPNGYGAVRDVEERRYRFWGEPGGIHDGHCINFLRHEDTWYLYDVSFLDHPVAVGAFTPPAPDRQRRIATSTLGGFQTAYLDKAVPFMLGSLTVDGKLYRSHHDADPGAGAPDTPCDTVNGLSVATPTLPKAGDVITFFWGP